MATCPDCIVTQHAIAWQRELMLDIARVYKINLNELDGVTPEAEWESLGLKIREKMGIDVKRG